MLGLAYLSDTKIASSVYTVLSEIKKTALEDISFFLSKVINIKNSNVHLSKTKNDIRDADYKILCVPLDSKYDFKSDSASLYSESEFSIDSGFKDDAASLYSESEFSIDSGFKDDAASLYSESEFSIDSESSYSPFPLLKSGKCLK